MAECPGRELPMRHRERRRAPGGSLGPAMHPQGASDLQVTAKPVIQKRCPGIAVPDQQGDGLAPGSLLVVNDGFNEIRTKPACVSG